MYLAPLYALFGGHYLETDIYVTVPSVDWTEVAMIVCIFSAVCNFPDGKHCMNG